MGGGRTRKRQTTTEQNKMKISGKQNGRAPASFAKRDTCRIENSQQKTENENAKTEKQTVREQEKEESMICKNDKKLMHCQSSSKHAKRDTSTLYEQEARRSSTPFCNACASASPHWWAAKRTFIVKLFVASVMASFFVTGQCSGTSFKCKITNTLCNRRGLVCQRECAITSNSLKQSPSHNRKENCSSELKAPSFHVSASINDPIGTGE